MFVSLVCALDCFVCVFRRCFKTLLFILRTVAHSFFFFTFISIQVIEWAFALTWLGAPLSVFQGHYYDQIPGGYTNKESKAIYENLKDVLCIPTMVGSHFEATSTK